MTAFVLDINDCHLSLWDGELLRLSSPGFCLRQGDHYSYGEPARSQARLQPRQIHHRFWWQLGLDPLQPAFGPARHSADLVHQHLLQLHDQGGKPEQLILAVPASMTTEQLSLLLGIVTQCPFEIAGVVDRGVAAAATVELAATSYQIELQLHQALVTELIQADGQIKRGAVSPIPGCGWLALQDALANAVADTFIRQTRYDPRRKAASEQKLYDSLPLILEDLQSAAECTYDLDGHQARLEATALQASSQALTDRIARAIPAGCEQLLIDPLLATLPGKNADFSAATTCSAAAIQQGIAAHRELIADSGAEVRHITQLPAAAATAANASQEAQYIAPGAEQTPPEPAPEAETAASSSRPPPAAAETHFTLDYEGGALTLHPGSGPAPRVNGRPLKASMQLRSGDTVETDEGYRLTISDMD